MTKAEIDRCLNCTRKTCTGNCAYYRDPDAPRKKRGGKKYAYQGEMLTLGEISMRCGISIQTLYTRVVRYGWSVEDAARLKVERRRPMLVEAFGEKNTLAVWSQLRSIPASVIKTRILSGWDPERALTEPVAKPRTLTVAGEAVSAAELARRLGMSDVWVRKRAKEGWTGDQIAEYYGGRK